MSKLPFSVAGPKYSYLTPLTTDRVLVTPGVDIDELVCKSCDGVLDEPVELACKHLLCRSCCFQLLKSHLESIPCPYCQQDHPLKQSSFQALPPLVDKLLQKVVIKCDREKCQQAIYLGDILRVTVHSNLPPSTNP